MIWAVNHLQNGEAEIAARYLAYPEEAVGAGISSNYRIHPWIMETLINELLSSPKQSIFTRRPTRTLNCAHFNAIASVVNALNELENAEAGVWLSGNDVRIEMHQIAQRQFPWQRGFFNLPQFYRSAFLYNFEAANTLFMHNNGVSIADFLRCGFVVYSYLSQTPFMPVQIDLSSAGITPEVRDATVRLIALTRQDARGKAKELRARPGQVAYKESVLRQHPCIVFNGKDGHVYAPVRELIVQRVTSGVYYDVIAGDGSIRNTIAKRFETYCEQLIQGFLSEVEVTPEFSYNGDRNRTPDLLLGSANTIFAVAECKATKMTMQAKFSDRPFDEAKRGYEEIRKAVIQLWRFFCHQRQGLVRVDSTVDTNAIGLVLTLEGWLEAFASMREETLERAKAHVRENELTILEEDMRPIVFCPVDDLEYTLSVASLDSFITALSAASTPQYAGYHLSSVHSELQEDQIPQKPYPFKDRISEVLPWWES